MVDGCPVGEELTVSGVCVKCSVGTYRPLDTDACMKCPYGFTSTVNGASSVTDCSVGKAFNKQDNS